MTHDFDDDLTETTYNTAPFYAKYGRIGRMRYLAYTVMLILCAVIPFLLGRILLSVLNVGSGNTALMITLITGIPGMIIVIYANFAPAMRRFNDLNRSSWWAALLIIPLINFLVILYLSFVAGDEDENDYGEPAEPPTTLIQIVGVIGFIFLIWISFIQSLLQFVPQ